MGVLLPPKLSHRGILRPPRAHGVRRPALRLSRPATCSAAPSCRTRLSSNAARAEAARRPYGETWAVTRRPFSSCLSCSAGCAMVALELKLIDWQVLCSTCAALLCFLQHEWSLMAWLARAEIERQSTGSAVQRDALLRAVCRASAACSGHGRAGHGEHEVKLVRRVGHTADSSSTKMLALPSRPREPKHIAL